MIREKLTIKDYQNLNALQGINIIIALRAYNFKTTIEREGEELEIVVSYPAGMIKEDVQYISKILIENILN